MATYTTNLNLKKPAVNDKIRIADFNTNADYIDDAIGAIGNTSAAEQIAKVEAGMAILARGNTHTAITAGQYVYVRGHDTLAEGLYTADTNISANATLTNNNLSAVSNGGLNSLSDNIASQLGLNEVAIADADNPPYKFCFFDNTTLHTPNKEGSTSAQQGIIISIRMGSNTYNTQFCMNIGTPFVFVRFRSGGSWNVWQRLALIDDIN